MRYTAPTAEEYRAAFQKLYDAADQHSGSTSRRSAQFLLALIEGRGAVDIQGIASNFDRGNIGAVMTILSGFRDHHVPEFRDHAATVQRLAEKASA